MKETKQKQWYATPYMFNIGDRVHVDGMQADRVFIIDRRKCRHFPPKANAIEWNDYHLWPEFGSDKPFWAAERHLKRVKKELAHGNNR